jgi:hypothetical protein
VPSFMGREHDHLNRYDSEWMANVLGVLLLKSSEGDRRDVTAVATLAEMGSSYFRHQPSPCYLVQQSDN